MLPQALDSRRNALLGWTTTLAGLAAGLVLALLSDGAYQDDDVCHLLFARDALGDASAMLHWWARPGYNVPASVFSQLGFFGARLLSLLQTALTAFLAWRIAVRLLGDTLEAALAPLLVWAQPLVLTLSITTLTETPAALYLTAAVALYLSGRRVLGCAALSLLFVTRYETLAIGVVFGLYVLWDLWQERGVRSLADRRLWGCAAAMCWAPLAYVLLAVLFDLSVEASPIHMFSREYTAEYGSGPWYHMFARWPQAAGLGVLALAAAGAAALRRAGGLVSLLVFALVGLQATIFTLGVFASGGYARFLVPVCALVAVLGAAGIRAIRVERSKLATAVAVAALALWPLVVAARFEWVARFVPWMIAGAALATPVVWFAARSRARWPQGLALGLVGVVTVGQLAGQVRPLTLEREPYHALLSQAVGEVAPRAPVITQHIMVEYWLDDVTVPPDNDVALQRWQEARPGTVYIWENKYSFKRHAPEATQALRRALSDLGERVWTRARREALVEIWVRR